MQRIQKDYWQINNIALYYNHREGNFKKQKDPTKQVEIHNRLKFKLETYRSWIYKRWLVVDVREYETGSNLKQNSIYIIGHAGGQTNEVIRTGNQRNVWRLWNSCKAYHKWIYKVMVDRRNSSEAWKHYASLYNRNLSHVWNKMVWYTPIKRLEKKQTNVTTKKK